MCYAGNCHPECDNCKPKYVTCPSCGERTFIARPKCLACGYELTDDDREAGRAEWRLKHPFSDERSGSTKY